MLLLASLREWLPEGHLAYFIGDVVDALELSAFYARYAGDGRRRQPYEPTLLVKVLIYAYASGVFSSRKIAQRLEDGVALRVLEAGNFPSHRTLREFRRVHLAEFSALFLQVVQLAREAGLVQLGRIGIDGTKVKANASRHKVMSYGRTGEREQQLRQEIVALTRQAEVQDAAEDRRYGKDRRGDELPAELARRESRLKVIQAAKARLEARQRERDQEAGRHRDDDGHTRGPGGRRCCRDFDIPPDTAQDNFTDPESRIMKTAHGFDPCYNVQAAVDEGSQLIVATEPGQQAPDVQQLVPMVQAVQRNVGALPTMTLADAGYASEANFVALEQLGAAACVSLAGRHARCRGATRTNTRPPSAWQHAWRRRKARSTTAGASAFRSRCSAGSSRPSASARSQCPRLGQGDRRVEPRVSGPEPATDAPTGVERSLKRGAVPHRRASFCIAARSRRTHTPRRRSNVVILRRVCLKPSDQPVRQTFCGPDS